MGLFNFRTEEEYDRQYEMANRIERFPVTDDTKILAIKALEELHVKYAHLGTTKLLYWEERGCWSAIFNYGFHGEIEAISYHWDLATAILMLKDKVEEKLKTLEELEREKNE